MQNKPTYEDLLEIIIELKKEMSILKDKLSKYENPKNSSNSSIPPSKDENRVQRNQSLREKSDKKVGGQPGHKGTTLRMAEQPDEIITHIPQYCNCCGEDLTDLKEEFVEKRQLIEIPAIKRVYIEHQVYEKRCNCGHLTQSNFPQNVKSNVQYGSSVESYISYFHSRQYVPFNRIKEMLSDIFDTPISEGGVHYLLKKFTTKAKPHYEEIKRRIEESEYVGTDETGAIINGYMHWYWTWQTPKLTFIVHSLNRGIKTIATTFAKGLPKSILGHDRWASHFHCDSKGHQLCTAHLLRDLKYLEELYQSEWASSMKELLMQSLELKKSLKPEEYDNDNPTRQSLEENLQELLTTAIDYKHEKAITLQKQLIKHRNYILLFLYHPKVPSDNNGSERAIRNIKVKQKISGQYKTDDGAQTFAINRSIIDTMIKSGQNVIAGLNLIANFGY